MDDESHYKILKLLQEDPHISQRAIAEVLGVSLGKTNYCLKALIGRGLIKAKNFRNSNNKAAYAYFLTPMGMEEKAKVTARFLKRKMAEYEMLREEIESLRREVSAGRSNNTAVPEAGIEALPLVDPLP
ncbi:MAG: MarR family EPS-associated transcriptional regulator [Gammaproteobacteria bacterium]|nr:MarR family EPS-associated transcriptional regulator [Gammaproteobacteria bacterium]